MNRVHVLLLFGGESSEHDVSVSSARNVYAAIDDEKYEVLPCYIDKQGKWWLLESIESHVDTRTAPQLLPVLGEAGFVTMPESNILKPDVILPILHGRNGEDGTVQGLAQLLHIPIVGCDMPSSSKSMDKLLTKEIADIHGIKVVPYTVHRANEKVPDFNKLSLAYGNTVFVKPSGAGSSVGVSKVHNKDELAHALELAHRHDNIALIEQAITARELEVALRGTPPNHQVSGVGEIIPGADFYSYDDKYASDSQATIKIPADITEDIARRIQADAKKIYEVLGCSGLARADFFLSDDGTVYFNEINTLPGFTNISMYPKLWQHEGISYSQLIEQLIQDAIR